MIACGLVTVSDSPDASVAAGHAVLIAGYPSAPDGDEATPLLRRIGEILLASPTHWRLRLLSPLGDEHDAPHRLGIKRALAQLGQRGASSSLLAIAATVHEAPSGPALVTAAEYFAYPEDATLSLAWIGERVRAVLDEDPDRARAFALVLSLRAAERRATSEDARRWLAALGLQDHPALVLVDASSQGDPLLAALAAGLLGEGVDPQTGTVTVRGLGRALVERAPSVAHTLAAAAASTFYVGPALAHRLELERALSATSSTTAHAPRGEAGAPLPAGLLGTVLAGRIRVDEELAQSATSVVYRGRQLAVDRDVAIKVLHGEVAADEESRRLFAHEIQAVGRIDHENVVRIYHADVTPDGRLFFAMERLDGEDLQRAIERGAVPAERARALMRQLLSGLAAVHEAGLVHADIKPGNAMLVPRRDGGERLVLIDFGLSRLRPGEVDARGAKSVGGTPAFMAPEQLQRGRVDPRSDVFAAGLVMVAMLTRWQRCSRAQLTPAPHELDGIEPGLRAPLLRALAIDPSARFSTATAMAAALAGEVLHDQPLLPLPPPFRRLAPFTEEDSARFFGRARDLESLVSQAISRRLVLLTAPSGTGKTSLLRGGLVPRLKAIGADPRYRSCRDDPNGWLRELAAAEGARRVVLVDQLEVLDEEADEAVDPLAQLVSLARSGAWPSDLHVVLSVREDHLPRMLGRLPRLDELVLFRLAPLARVDAHEAITRPLAEHRCVIAAELLERLLDDLEAAAAEIGPELGWGKRTGIYPPHLQLACSVLYESLTAGESEITLAHYQGLGGLAAIVGEHLDRVMESELAVDEVAIARDLFLALVTATQDRAAREEEDLLGSVGAAHGDKRVGAVLEVLRKQGLLARSSRDGGRLVWELMHDSLVPRVLSWIDRRDLARRQILEQLRHHLRRSKPERPSLLSRGELRELRAHPRLADALEEEWARRSLDPSAWTPKRLIARSRQMARRTAGATFSIAALALLAVGAAALDRARSAAATAREQTLRDRDQGHFVLELAPFDWDAEAMKQLPRSPSDLPALRWTLHRPDAEDRDHVGAPLEEARLVRGAPVTSGMVRRQLVEAPGGAAFLVVEGRGRAGERCAPSVVPLRALPGYASRNGAPPVLRIPVPTCQASLADAVEIPAGPFLRGGAGEPPAAKRLKNPVLSKSRRVELGRYRIDRFELTNAAIAPLVEIASLTGIRPPVYVKAPQLEGADAPAMPATNLTWAMARTYCAFWGKRLPTSEEWEKAFRGGLTLLDGSVNPVPMRTTAWGTATIIGFANISLHESFARLAKVGGYASDLSPFGLYDMTGNASEWLVAIPNYDGRYIRGGNWGDTVPGNFTEFTASDNPRPSDAHDYRYGARCVQD